MKYIIILAFAIPASLFAQSGPAGGGNTDLDGTDSYSKFMSVKSIFSKKESPVHPYPVSDFISISSAVENFKVVNSSGWNVSELIPRSEDDRTLLNISDLLPGLYFIQFENGQSSTFIKM